jgi:DNA repair protein RadC
MPRNALSDVPSQGIEVPHYTGHRERLRARFLDHGASALADYELLELVLFDSVPRVDVKPLAKLLLKQLGDFAEVVAAPRPRLAELGLKERSIVQLKIIEAAALRLSKTRLFNRPAISSWSALLDYCTATMARSGREEFRVLFLDRKNSLIADEVLTTGTVDHTPVYPREIVKRALELSACALILVHNHPSGDPAPSRADVAMTAEVVAAAKALKIDVHDHLVVGRSGHASFKSLGLL